MLTRTAARALLQYMGLTTIYPKRTAAAGRAHPGLRDVSKLRYQAVFLMGAGGSGKGFIGKKLWLKYMPGGGSHPQVSSRAFAQELSEQERSLSNLEFESLVETLKKQGIRVEPVEGGLRMPFKLYQYGPGGMTYLDPKTWEKDLPPAIFDKVKGLTSVVFSAPKAELPSYWRQIDPDLYKKELAGYMDEQPGYVHEMSSEMAKAYLEAAVVTGDPLLVDGTGQNPVKMAGQMKACQDAGYRVSLVFVYTDLTTNQIRNSTRDRKVNPNEIVKQWGKIQESYNTLKSLADKAKVIINNNPEVDAKVYRANQEAINSFIQQNTKYDSLFELIEDVRPQELSNWGNVIR